MGTPHRRQRGGAVKDRRKEKRREGRRQGGKKGRKAYLLYLYLFHFSMFTLNTKREEGRKEIRKERGKKNY